MKTYRIKTDHIKLLADTVTPVSIYLKLRDKFPNSLLLESSDYHGNENSFSYICCSPIASFTVRGDVAIEKYPDGKVVRREIDDNIDLPQLISDFAGRFQTEPSTFNFINNGLFGYTSYDAVRFFEDIQIQNDGADQKRIPDIHYSVYRFIIAINHFKNELYIFEHNSVDIEKQKNGISKEYIESLIQNKNYASYGFQSTGKETSNFDDENFLKIIASGIEHCHRGDVYQIVLSRRYTQPFRGDEFNVYRALRSINPSPYLFYFDYGDFKIFGSSPEAQLVIKDKKASIFPIAGTFKRTGDDAADTRLAQKLQNDPKENSEHIMLVDLARNDLSRNGTNVEVEIFKDIQYYSHVIHLVSKVSCEMNKETNTMKVVADTFPAGTLSGAPKHRAMQLIDRYEKGNRGIYGGCIGFIGFNGDFNHAIIIRSFLSIDNELFYQAGAGIVAKSKVENEMQEITNKLAALRNAITMAEKTN